VGLDAITADRIEQFLASRPRSAAKGYNHLLGVVRAMSRRLLKFSGGSVDDYATFSTTSAIPSC
jgi:hypothetical protein